MDNPDTNPSLFSLRISENTKMQLRGAAVVAGVAAIFALTSSVLKLVMAFMNKDKTTVSNIEGFTQSKMSVEKGGNIGGAIFSLIISILLFYFLNKFSSQVKTGLNGNNQQLINNGLGGLSGYFITVGIFVIILLVLLLILFAGAGVGSR
jgi:hypothetical protein